MSDLTNFVKDNIGDSISKESTTNTNGQIDGTFSGDAIKDESSVNSLHYDKKPTVVSIIGFPGYGKTCFIATIYQILLNEGKLDEFSFVDSDTFVGFERRIYMRRCSVLDENSAPQTKRTLRGEGHILTLRFTHPQDGEKIIIVTDRSGEDYIDCANQKNKINDHLLLKHSDYVLLFVDSTILVDCAQMMELSDTLSDLLINIQQAQAIQKSAQILIVFNKIDAVELSTQFQKSSDTIEALIKEKFPLNNIVSKRIVSNNIANSKGLKQLFSEIVNFDTTAITHNDRDYEGIDWVNNIIKQKKNG